MIPLNCGKVSSSFLGNTQRIVGETYNHCLQVDERSICVSSENIVSRALFAVLSLHITRRVLPPSIGSLRPMPGNS
jgi:hypothetical protein